MNIHGLLTMNTNRHAPINYREVELRSEQAVNTTLGSSGINESLDPCHARSWRGLIRMLVRGVEAYINDYCGSTSRARPDAPPGTSWNPQLA